MEALLMMNKTPCSCERCYLCVERDYRYYCMETKREVDISSATRPEECPVVSLKDYKGGAT